MITFMLLLHLSYVGIVRNQAYIDAFGLNLKRIRLQKKLSREKLAAYSDIEVMQVYRIETGRINTTISTVLALAKGLEIHPRKLLDFDVPQK